MAGQGLSAFISRKKQELRNNSIGIVCMVTSQPEARGAHTRPRLFLIEVQHSPGGMPEVVSGEAGFVAAGHFDRVAREGSRHQQGQPKRKRGREPVAAVRSPAALLQVIES